VRELQPTQAFRLHVRAEGEREKVPPGCQSESLRGMNQSWSTQRKKVLTDPTITRHNRILVFRVYNSPTSYAVLVLE